MATRSRIGIEKEDGTIQSIYCHWDGYPSHNGAILLENYTTKEKVEALLELGAISILAKNLAPEPGVEHDFSKPAADVVVAYHRDRGENMDKPRTNASLAAFAKSDFEEYGYIFTKENKWMITFGDCRIEDLTPKMCGLDVDAD
jgi:hypothetical protein